MRPQSSSRRWQRHPVVLPVRIVAHNGVETVISGRGTELSEGGMALYVPTPMQPGDRTEVEFQTPLLPKVECRIRNRTGLCLGLEFEAALPIDLAAKEIQTSAVHLVHAAVNVIDRIKAIRNNIAAHKLMAEVLGSEGEIEAAEQSERQAALLAECLRDLDSLLRQTERNLNRALPGSEAD